MNTKQTIWQETFTFAVPGMSVYTTTMSELRVENDTVYLFTTMFNGAGGSWLTAFDAATGRHLWSRTGVLSLAEANMVVCQGRIFLCGHLGNQLEVLDGVTGTTLWSYPHLKQSVSVVHDTVFIIETSSSSRSPQPELECFVRALRLEDGQELWATSLGPYRALPPKWTHLATHDSVYAIYPGSGTSGSAVVYALDTRDGTIRWMSPPGIYSRPVLADDQFLYLYGGNFGAVLNVATGAPLWSRQIDEIGETIGLPDHSFYGRAVLGYLSAYRGTDGECLWYCTQGMSQSSGSQVTIDDTNLYFVGGEHDKIYAVDRKTGSEQLFLEIEPSEKPAWLQERFYMIAVR